MTDVEKMVRAQIALFRARDIQADAEVRTARKKETYGPYLLISREKGAGGSAVAKLVGTQLGWHVFDRELVDAIAEKTHVRRELIESLDEHDRTSIRDAVESLIHSRPLKTAGYLASLHEILLTLGHQGNVVIVGRCAPFVLPSKNGCRVRLVAPVAVRIQRIAAQKHIRRDDARREVERSDRERSRFSRHHFGCDVCDPLFHDLTINTAELTVEGAARMVVVALETKLGVRRSLTVSP